MITPVVLAVGVVDAERIAGTAADRFDWSDLGVEAPGDGRTMRVVFGKTDTTYRRLDRVSRSLVLAGEAAGIGRLLTPEQCNDAALIAESTVGCLEVDRRYTDSLSGEVIEAAIFPYTLPSTSLGELALRHGIRGPTLAMSVEPVERGASLREAQRMLAAGEVAHVVAAAVDVLDREGPGLPVSLSAVVALLGTAEAAPAGVAAWPGSVDDPFGALAQTQ